MAERGRAARVGDAMIDVTIRPATAADITALLALYAEFHSFHVAGMADRLREPEQRDDADVRAALDGLLRAGDAALLVAADGDQVIGLAEVYLKRDEENPWRVGYTYGHLQSLMVAAAWRRAGIGARLVTAAEAWARERGAAEMRLETWEFPAGPLAFYEARGYRTLRRTLARRL
jgi:GNAT superfamily N-acetyltransferase